MSKKVKENDFFNLNSDSDDCDDDKNVEKSSKWDWDRPENKQLYFSKSEESFKKSKSGEKRTLNDYKEAGTSKKLFKSSQPDESQAANNNMKYQLIGHTDSVNRIHWSKKPQNENLLLSSSMDSTIIIWDVTRKSPNNILQKLTKLHTRSIRNTIWSNTEAEICSVSYDKTSVLCNVETGKEMSKISCDNILTAISSHPLNNDIYLLGSYNCVYAWDTRTSQICKKYESKMNQVQDILFINDSEFVTSGDVVFRESAEYALMVWDYATTAVVSNQLYHEKFICTCLKNHPIWNVFFVQTHGNYIAEFSTRRPYKMNKFKRFEGHESQGYSIGFDVNPEGNQIISGSIDGNALIYSTTTTKPIRTIRVFNSQQACMDAKFNPHVKYRLAFSSSNGLISVDDKCK